ncbi:MAG: cyclase family protein [Anaerolineae bacterium]
MTRLVDLTRRIAPDLPVWPGDLPPIVTTVASHAAGDGYALSHIAATLHLGTHIDAPLHYVAGGAAIADLDLTALVGPAVVVAVPEGVRAIDAPLLERLASAPGVLPDGAERVLFRTRNSADLVDGRDPGPFRRDYVAVTAGAARWLVERGIRLVGVDGPSIAPWDDVDTPHAVLLGAGIVVVEGLALADAPAGGGTLVCLPLRIDGADGAPARAILIVDE